MFQIGSHVRVVEENKSWRGTIAVIYESDLQFIWKSASNEILFASGTSKIVS